ncbi:MAG: hypothetical protein J2P48_12730 [Alphaproteobacteria bacterium]|nr:hypothetical protein [Alphaproteobacteria bacterium]
MHKTHLPICTWLIPTYPLATSCKGISSLKLASLLGLQYRAKWYLTRRIRPIMGGNPDLLHGIVELDGTFIGGRPRRRNKPTRCRITHQMEGEMEGLIGTHREFLTGGALAFAQPAAGPATPVSADEVDSFLVVSS